MAEANEKKKLSKQTFSHAHKEWDTSASLVVAVVFVESQLKVSLLCNVSCARSNYLFIYSTEDTTPSYFCHWKIHRAFKIFTDDRFARHQVAFHFREWRKKMWKKFCSFIASFFAILMLFPWKCVFVNLVHLECFFVVRCVAVIYIAIRVNTKEKKELELKRCDNSNYGWKIAHYHHCYTSKFFQLQSTLILWKKQFDSFPWAKLMRTKGMASIFFHLNFQN